MSKEIQKETEEDIELFIHFSKTPLFDFLTEAEVIGIIEKEIIEIDELEKIIEPKA